MSDRFAIVLGAAGFIGRHVCLELARQGLRVHGVGHGDWDRAEWSRWGISSWLAADVSLASITEAAGAAAPQALIHCAGTSSVAAAQSDPLKDFERSVTSVAASLEYARRLPSARARVVLASSAAVYGEQGDFDLPETAMRAPMSTYGYNKMAAEQLCDLYSRFHGGGVSIVRLFSVYGEGLRKQLLWDASCKFAVGESRFFGTGHELRDWVHVEDAARLLCLAAVAQQPPFEIYNGGHTKASTRQVLETLARHRTPAPTVHFTGETHAGNPRRLTANCDHAHRQLGWNPRVSLDEGLVRYAAWCENAHR